MTLTKIIKYIILCFLTIWLAGCDDDFADSEYAHVKVNVILPSELNGELINDASINFRNLTSGYITNFCYPSDNQIKVLPGLYDIEYTGTLISREGNSISIKGVRRSVQILSSGTTVSISTYCNLEIDDLIISEIFYTGTLQNSGNQYLGDDYVKLYNNTDHIIFADGITLFESKFMTTEKQTFIPDIMNEAVTVQAMYTIPGSGKEHPINPGEFVLLADVAIDHRTANPNSFSLAHADWEWYDESVTPGNLDIDNPLVPNLDKWYSYTQSFWMLHNRGFKAYGIARIPIDKEEYLQNYRYSYDYEIVTNAGTFPMNQTAYKIPNEWIIDVVNCSVESEWKWNVTAPSLDIGWAYCGFIDKDKTRFFHSIRRKLLYLREDGTPVLKDTNNSSLDFNSHTTPSEIELQHTIIGLGCDTAKTITYDGITPVSD